MPNPPVVVTAADRNFAMQLAVMLQSVSAAYPQDRVSVFVLEDGFTAADKAKVVSGLHANLEIEWRSASSTDTAAARLPEFLSAATTFRLRMPDLLPQEITRLAYIDADTIVRQPVDELVNADIGAALVGAVRDPASPFAGISLPWRTMHFDPKIPYYNAGILVVPLDVWRAESVGPRAFELLTKYDFRWGDNCALNTICNGNWAELNPKWNVQSGHFEDRRAIWSVDDIGRIDAAARNPAIVHFNNPPRNRPWNERCVNPFASEWREHLARTAFAGWRPAQPTPRQRFKLRLSRSIHALTHD